MTRPDEHSIYGPAATPYQRFIRLLSSAYLVGMVAYLFLRLIFGDSLWWLALLNTFAVYTFAPAFILLVLAALAGMWREVVRLAMVAILGTIWFGQFFQARSVPPPAGPTLSIATFNLHGDFNPRLDDAAAWLGENAFDIAALQEVPTAFLEAHLPTLIQTYPYQVVTPGRILLSQHPIVNQENVIDFQQRVVIDYAGQQVAVYHVHFYYPLARPPRVDLPLLRMLTRYDENARNAQIEALLAQVAADPLPYLVVGDLNMSQHSIIYSALALQMEDSFRVTGSGLGATWPVDGTLPFPMLRLDYVWYQPRTLRAVASRVWPALGSDHAPYSTQIELLLPAAPTPAPR